MATSVGTHPYQYILADLGDAANIQTALKQFYYGNTGLTPTVGQGIYGAIYNTFNSPTIAGTLTLSNITAAALSSPSGAFQIGASSGANLVASPAIIQARNNGSAAALSVNSLGGNITLGNASTTVTITGDLVVSGNTTTINTATLDVEDAEISLGKVASPTDTTAANGGIRLLGATDKLLTWVPATQAWTSNQDFNLLSTKVYEINGTTVLSATEVLGREPGGTAAGDLATIDATQTLTSKSFSDATTFFVDSADATKKLNVDVTGTTGITGTLRSAFTTAKTITLPDITGTALVTAGTTATAGYFDTGTTAPSGTTRLNYGGYLYATRMYGDQFNSVTGTAATAGLFSDVTTGSVGLGVNAQTIGIGSNTITAQTINIGTGATGMSVTKTLNLATGAGTGGITVVNIGGNPAVSTSTITLNGTTTAALSNTSTAVTGTLGDRSLSVATNEFVSYQVGESFGSTIFGWGTDGSYTLNASQAAVAGLFTKSGNIFTLIRTAYFGDLNIASGYTLDPGGYAFYVSGTLTMNGANAIAHTATVGGNAQTTYAIGNGGGNAISSVGLGYQSVSSGTAGGNGGPATSAGSNGTAAGAPTWASVYANTWRQSRGGTGGTGGTGLAGGTGGTVQTDAATREWRYPLIQFMSQTTQPPFVPSGTSLLYYMNASGTGGGGGGGSPSSNGAGGGGGGQANTGAFIFANNIITSGTANEISFVGAAGGNGGAGNTGVTGGGGGGAGGQGGFVFIVSGNITGGFSGSAINVSGGTGGNGGSGAAGGIGAAGAGGYSGVIAFSHLGKGTFFISGLNANSGQTAGALTMPILQ